MPAETIAVRLKRLRLAAGLSQKELAEPEFTHAYVSTIEAGKREPSHAAVEAFAGRLGVEPDELQSGRPADLVPRMELELQEARRAASAGASDDAAVTFARLAEEAEREDLVRLQARAEIGLGLCAEFRGDTDEAISFYEGALQTLKDEPPNFKAEAVACLSRCLQQKGEIRTAIYVLEQALESLERAGLLDPDAIVRLNASLVAAYFEQGAYAKAAASAENALALAPRTTNPEHQASMHANVARIFLSQGRREDAHASLQRAEELYRHLDLQIEIARCHGSRGHMLSRQGELEPARAELLLAREAFQQAGARIAVGRTITELARVERLQGRIDSAKEWLDEAQTLFRDEDLFDLGEVYRELGLCAVDEDPSEAEAQLRRAAALFEEAEQSAEYATTCRMLGDLLESRGKEAEAIEAYRAGLAAVEESFETS